MRPSLTTNAPSRSRYVLLEGALAPPVDDCVRERLELLPVEAAVEARPRPLSVVERHLMGPLEGAGGGDAHERALHRTAGERRAHDPVLPRRQQQRQRRRPLAEVGTRDLPGLDRVTGAVEDVVGDLEGDPEVEPEAR